MHRGMEPSAFEIASVIWSTLVVASTAFVVLHIASFVFLTGSATRVSIRQMRAESTAFPDLHIETVRSFGQGDWVCVEWVVTGTHTGPLMGPGGETIPATNKTARVPGSR